MDLRPAREPDLPEILRIYNQTVEDSTATFDLEPVTVQQRRHWFGLFGDKNPMFVCEVDGQVAGFAYYLPYRAKKAYAHSKELSIYVDSAQHRRGIGSALMQRLLDHAEEHGVHVMIGVLGGDNPASLRLHQKFGFEEVGCLKEVGHKFGTWVDTTFLQKTLSGPA